MVLPVFVGRHTAIIHRSQPYTESLKIGAAPDDNVFYLDEVATAHG